MQKLQIFRKFICCVQDPLFPNPYNFQFGKPADLDANKLVFQSNFVRTSKYRWYDFLPKSLIIQFYRLANVYFLIIAILQSITIISPLGPLTAWGPLIVVLGISMVREGYEDYQRYKSDQQLNHQYKTHVLRQGKFLEVEWQDVVIGDICLVKEKQLFPADLILMVSQHLDGNAFIETASLDGEKNLKPRNAYPQTQKFNSVQSISKLCGKWEGIIPDKNTQNFQSTLLFQSVKINYKKEKQLLWRGTRLMNTKWIYGLAIYTGVNTKIMKNSEASSSKMSQIEIKVNQILAFILVVQIVLSIICAFLAGFFNTHNSSSNNYIQFSYSGAVDGLITFFSYFVLINTMIPISLIVSIQIVKMTQSYFIDKDQFMYSEFRKKGASTKSASLNEELGQIQHIFSDKTGTLTTNRMEFKIAVIGSTMFGDLGLIMKDQNFPPQQQTGFHDDKLKRILQSREDKFQKIREITIKDRQKKSTISLNNIKKVAIEYLTALSIAHQVVVQTDEATGKKVYQGPSPDEITLVDAAKEMGFQFLHSTQKTTEINSQGENKTYELLETFPFNSDRKRMSIVIRDNGVIKMYIKGADSIIKQRLAPDQTLNLDDQLTKFSNIGLRTLLIGMRIISQQEYRSFTTKGQALPVENRDQQFKKLVEQLETNIYLIGATAVLDRLQDEVPETIRDLIRANIKIWMLTGDKMETAQNIAKSCNLIQPQFKVLKCRFKHKGIEEVQKSLFQLRTEAQNRFKDNQKMSLMVEGSDLAQIIQNDTCQEHFISIAEKCQSVVCCRLLPIQKAEVVKMVRLRLNKITLAIGDGANDVPMIKAAHIGIGLFGEEGMGAVQASDYALPQFRMLWRLLLVHGRWNYIRIAEMILYFFYKNMLFTFPQFIFAFYCGYSAQTIFEDMYVSLFNLIFTSIPLIVRAVFQQDIYYLTKIKEGANNQDSSANMIRPELALRPPSQSKFIPKGYEINKYLYRLFPKIYYVGQQNLVFNKKSFIFWIIEGVLQSIVITLFTLYILDAESLNNSGYSTDMWIASLAIYSSVIFIVTFKLAAHTKFMSKMLLLSLLFLGIGVYVCYMWISNYFFSYTIVNTTYMFFTSGQTYFLVLFGTCLVLVVDGIILSFDDDSTGMITKLRNIIDQQKYASRSAYEMNSIKFTVGTVQARNDS